MAPSRAAGRALLAFGSAGLVLLAAAALLVVSTLGSLSATAADLESQRDQLVAMVGPAGSSLRSSATAARNAGASLAQSATAAREGAALMTQLATSLDQLATLSNLDFLGQRPFGAAGTSFADTAARARTLAGNLTTTAEAIDTNVADTGTVASDLDALATQLESLRASLADSPPPPPGWTWLALDAVALGLLAWLGVAAFAAARIGWRWSRRG